MQFETGKDVVDNSRQSVRSDDRSLQWALKGPLNTARLTYLLAIKDASGIVRSKHTQHPERETEEETADSHPRVTPTDLF